MEELMFLTQKINGIIKGRMVYNLKPTHYWLSQEEYTIPTVSLKNILTTAVIDVYEDLDDMSADVPNIFIQNVIPDGDEGVIMNIKGVLVNLLV